MPNQDADRYRRIRDQQLQARDPQKKQRRLDYEVSAKQKRMKQSFSLSLMWRDLSHKIRYTLIGLMIGLAFMLLLPMVLPETWGLCLGLTLLGFATFIGFLVGRYEDSVEDIRRHLH
jgi:hypothetical protein